MDLVTDATGDPSQGRLRCRQQQCSTAAAAAHGGKPQQSVTGQEAEAEAGAMLELCVEWLTGEVWAWRCPALAAVVAALLALITYFLRRYPPCSYLALHTQKKGTLQSLPSLRY